MTTSSKQLKALYTNLMVADVSKTCLYYEKLGFKTIQQSPSTSPEWAMIQKDAISFMFQSTTSLQTEFPQLQQHPNGAGLTLWIQVNQIEDYYKQVKEHVQLLQPIGITEYNGATEFIIEDLNGFILHFSDFEL